jgi:hypothetical protein
MESIKKRIFMLSFSVEGDGIHSSRFYSTVFIETEKLNLAEKPAINILHEQK